MAGLMVEDARDAMPLAVRSHFFGRPFQLSNALADKEGQTGIKVLFQRSGKASGGQQLLTTAILNGSTSIHEIKLTGRAKGWFKAGDKLVFGGRELLEHETVGDLQKGNESGILHVYVKLSDLTGLSLTLSDGQQNTFSTSYAQPTTPRKSALTAALSTPSPRSLISSSRCLVKGQVLDGHTPLGDIERSQDDVLHLIIRRPKVNYSIKKDSFELTITATDEIKLIKDKIEAHHGLPADSHTLVWNGQRLSASKSLASYGVQMGSVLELIPLEPVTPVNLPSGSPVLSSPQHELYEGWLKARAGLAAGVLPKLAPAGTGGSYFIQDKSGESVAVFKPEDEEPLAPNNPKGHSSGGLEGYKKGVRPGEGAVREVAAFLLDHEHFAGVPPTALVSCQETANMKSSPITSSEAKVGSLQAFVKAEGDCEERGTGIFDVEQVHKIAILDMRLGNCDRNGGNILVKRVPGNEKPEYQLIPIDHGYCLPSTFADITFEWMYWPQAEKPFSERSLKYISSLDVEKDCQTLKAHGLYLRPECDLVRKVCTMVLKKGAARGLTPSGIASIMCRELLTKSPLESMHSTVIAVSQKTNQGEDFNESLYLERMSCALDEYLDDLHVI